MERRSLGRTGLAVSVVGLGLGRALFGGRTDDAESAYRVMDHAMEKGINLFDTAEAYIGGTSEKVFGKWLRLRNCRDKVTIFTKCWAPGTTGWGRPESIRKALHGSLDRLQTDYVDVYMLHFPDPGTPIADTLAALTEEIRAGRIRTIGCSNFSSSELQQALNASASHSHSRFEVIEPEYNLATSPYGFTDYPVGLFEAEDHLFPLCQRENIAVVTYSPLAAGFLTGKYARDNVTPNPGSRFQTNPDLVKMYPNERNFRTLDRLRERAAALHVPVARLAMAWAMTHQAVTAVIIGARSADYIDAAIEASQMKLDPTIRAEMSSWPRVHK